MHPKLESHAMIKTNSEVIGLGAEVARYVKTIVDQEIDIYIGNKQQEAVEALENFMKDFRAQQVKDFLQARETIANRIVVEALGGASRTSYLKVYLKEPEKNDTE